MSALLILSVEACVKTISELGRTFPWQKPDRCSRCGGRVWAHGFTLACFDGYSEPLWLKRYRCPDCRAVFRVRPSGYFSRFQASIAAIRHCLSQRLTCHRWVAALSKSRQRHWLKALLQNIRLHLGAAWWGNPLDAFDVFLAQGVCAVARSM
jgi:hypothetical protein